MSALLLTTPTIISCEPFDFDEASTAWRANKCYIGNGTYKYICMAITVKGRPCKKKPTSGASYCSCHIKYVK